MQLLVDEVGDEVEVRHSDIRQGMHHRALLQKNLRLSVLWGYGTAAIQGPAVTDEVECVPKTQK